eukprot:scaffold13660_cov54-Phaeocystis_antarctica.AAC.1
MERRKRRWSALRSNWSSTCRVIGAVSVVCRVDIAIARTGRAPHLLRAPRDLGGLGAAGGGELEQEREQTRVEEQRNTAVGRAERRAVERAVVGLDAPLRAQRQHLLRGRLRVRVRLRLRLRA